MNALRPLHVINVGSFPRKLLKVLAPIALAAVVIWAMERLVALPGPGSIAWADGDPDVRFSSGAYTVSEAGGSVEISVSLDTSPTVTATVYVSSTDSSAVGLNDLQHGLITVPLLAPNIESSLNSLIAQVGEGYFEEDLCIAHVILPVLALVEGD